MQYQLRVMNAVVQIYVVEQRTMYQSIVIILRLAQLQMRLMLKQYGSTTI